MRAAPRIPKLTVGLDLGDRFSVLVEMSDAGTVVKSDKVATTPESIRAYFTGRARCRVALEVGTHSPWVSRELEALGHEAIVANASEVYGKRRRKKRNDKIDADFLARTARVDVKMLHPIRHRSLKAQADLEIIRARDQVVRARTKLVNHVRGAVKAVGKRVGRCSADAFARRAGDDVPAELEPATQGLVRIIADLTKQIHAYDRQIELIIAERYPEALHLQQIAGVGPITALAFILLIEDPKRFSNSRDVGPYFGLVPQLDDSSDYQPQLGITKAGDDLGRRLLVSSAKYILGPFGPDTDLRRHGEAIAARGGKNARKRAAVAVARKLAVLMHRLWITQKPYDPDYVMKRRAA